MLSKKADYVYLNIQFWDFDENFHIIIEIVPANKVVQKGVMFLPELA